MPTRTYLALLGTALLCAWGILFYQLSKFWFEAEEYRYGWAAPASDGVHALSAAQDSSTGLSTKVRRGTNYCRCVRLSDGSNSGHSGGESRLADRSLVVCLLGYRIHLRRAL